MKKNADFFSKHYAQDFQKVLLEETQKESKMFMLGGNMTRLSPHLHTPRTRGGKPCKMQALYKATAGHQGKTHP